MKPTPIKERTIGRYIFLAILSLFLLALVGYYMREINNRKVVNNSTKSRSAATSTWNTYKLGEISISYPKSWNLRVSDNNTRIDIGSYSTTLSIYLMGNPHFPKFDIIPADHTEMIDISTSPTKFNFYTSTVTQQKSAFTILDSPIYAINFYLDRTNEVEHLKTVKEILKTIKLKTSAIPTTSSVDSK